MADYLNTLLTKYLVVTEEVLAGSDLYGLSNTQLLTLFNTAVTNRQAGTTVGKWANTKHLAVIAGLGAGTLS